VADRRDLLARLNDKITGLYVDEAAPTAVIRGASLREIVRTCADDVDMYVRDLPTHVRTQVDAFQDAKLRLAAAEGTYFSRRELSWTKEATIQRLRRDYSLAMLDYASARMALCEAMDECRMPARWLTADLA
jgi:hypothetical protein